MRRLRTIGCCLAITWLCGPTSAYAHSLTTMAMDVDPSVDPSDPTVVISGTATTPGTVSPGDETPVSDSFDSPPRDYEWLLACSENRPGRAMVDCAAAQTCTAPGESRWVLWARELPDGDWYEYAFECYKTKPPIPDRPARPTVTPDMVEEAVRRLGLPSLPLQVQPADATLVNFDTIFYTEPQPFDHTVTIVGFDVRVLAEPVSYGWAFGDGSAMTTGIPGAPYPAKDVVHRYDDAHVTVEPSVDVTYEIRYAVDGGAFQQLDTTLTAQGPPTGLRIREATALLAGTD